MTESWKNAPPPSGAGKPAPGAVGGDAFVDRLADRLGNGGDLDSDGRDKPESDAISRPSALNTAPTEPPGPSAELPPESTAVDERQLIAEESTARIGQRTLELMLHVEQGADRGRRFALQEGDNTVGRGIDNDVILADVAVSRRHLIITRQGDVLRMRDLGSGNGTLINGEKLGRVGLNEGDRIAIGETVLCVAKGGAAIAAPSSEERTFDETPTDRQSGRDPALSPPAGYRPPPIAPEQITPFRPMRKPRRARGAFLITVIGGSLGLVMLAAALAIMIVRGPPPSILGGNGADSFRAGVAAYEARRWDAAETAFSRALEQSGSDARANDYLQRTRRAREHAESLATARAALEAGDHSRALAIASGVPRESPYWSRAQEVTHEAESQVVSGQIAAARAALAAGDRDGARRWLSAAQSLDVDRDAVRTAQQELTEADVTNAAVAVPPQPEVPDEPPAVALRSSSSPRPSSRGSAASSSSSGASAPHDAAAAAIAAYRAGHLDQAIAAARGGGARANASELATRLERFARLWGGVEAGAFGPSAQSEMEQAMALDRQISPASPYGTRLKAALVRLYLAEAERHGDDTGAACSAARRALALDRRAEGAAALSARCASRASELLRQSPQASPERAIAMYREVLTMVPSDSALAREARSGLEALRRRQAYDEDE